MFIYEIALDVYANKIYLILSTYRLVFEFLGIIILVQKIMLLTKYYCFSRLRQRDIVLIIFRTYSNQTTSPTSWVSIPRKCLYDNHINAWFVVQCVQYQSWNKMKNTIALIVGILISTLNLYSKFPVFNNIFQNYQL